MNNPSAAARAAAVTIKTSTNWKPRRRLAHIVVPVGVGLVIAGVLYVSAREALIPATPIDVAPAVFMSDASRGRDARDSSGVAANQPARASRGVTVQAPGWLEADPFYVACTSRADGIVAEMYVLEGERVEAGQVVARLIEDDARLALAQVEAEVASERAQLAMAEADVAAAQTDWDNPVERNRQVATSAAALARMVAELLQLPALINVEQASLERLQEELARMKHARQSGAVNPLEVIIQEKRVDAQEATVRSMKLREAILGAQRDELAAEHAAAKRNAELRVAERQALDVARAVRDRGLAELKMTEAKRDEALLRLERMTIRAPISGFVQRRLKVPGDKVMLGMDDPHSAHLVHLYDPSTIQVRVDVPLAEASHVFVGQRCEVIVEVLPDRTFTGEVTRVTHEADLQKNTLQVKVRVVEPSPLLRPEMLTRVKFLPMSGGDVAASDSGAIGDSLVRVPQSSLVRGSGDRASVWVVRNRRGDRGVVHPIDVQVQGVDGGWASVQGSLQPGDLVALKPAGLRPEQMVRMTAGIQHVEGGGTNVH